MLLCVCSIVAHIRRLRNNPLYFLVRLQWSMSVSSIHRETSANTAQKKTTKSWLAEFRNVTSEHITSYHITSHHIRSWHDMAWHGNGNGNGNGQSLQRPIFATEIGRIMWQPRSRGPAPMVVVGQRRPSGPARRRRACGRKNNVCALYSV